MFLHPHLKVYDFTVDELIDIISGWGHLLLKRGSSAAERLFREALQKEPGDEELENTYPIFHELKLKLDEHIRKEGNILFPHALKILGEKVGADAPEPLSVGLLKSPLHAIEADHNAMMDLLGKLRKGFRNFSLCKGDERKKRMVVGAFFFLEQTLYGHAHVQHNILFPKLMEAEDKIIKRWV